MFPRLTRNRNPAYHSADFPNLLRYSFHSSCFIYISAAMRLVLAELHTDEAQLSDVLAS